MKVFPNTNYSTEASNYINYFYSRSTALNELNSNRIKNRKVNYRSMKTQCIQLEKNIFNFINAIRQEPSQIFSYFYEPRYQQL